MQLPPLDSVRFFEVAARRLSVRLAADELHVTPGAVSQQIRKLERYLDRVLFDRLPRGLALTSAGVEYYAACQEALSMIGRATTRLKGNRRRSILISCTASFASQWLVPRLQGFMQSSPVTDVHVSTTNRVVDLVNEGVHFAVRHGLGSYAGLMSEALVDDDLIAVCSPRLIAPRRTATAREITGPRLLHDEHRGDWRLWLEATGLSKVDANGGIVFVDSNAAIEAALAGRGFAMVRRALVESEIAARRLVVVRAPTLRVELAYHLIYRRETLVDPELRQFRDWLMNQRSE